VNRQLVADLDVAADLVDIGKVELRIDALRVQVQRQRDQVNVAGALAVAEETALDAVGARHDSELGGGHAGAAIVVRVQAEHDRGAPREMSMHPLDLVGVDVGGRDLDGGRQVDDRLVLGRRLPDLGDRVADLLGEGELGRGEGFRAVFEAPIGVRLRGRQVAYQPRRAGRDLDDAVGVLAEDHAPKQRRSGVVEVQRRARRPAQRLEGARDQIVSRGGQHLDAHVVGDQALLDQRAHEVEIGLRRRGERHLDFLETDRHQSVEHAALARAIHRLDQRLVAVAQVGAAPERRARDGLVRPGSIGERYRGCRAVLLLGMGNHDGSLASLERQRLLKDRQRLLKTDSDCRSPTGLSSDRNCRSQLQSAVGALHKSNKYYCWL
jgi:hypothetical protein